MRDSMLVDWTDDDYRAVERGVLLARHRLHQEPLFSDEQLCRIIDAHPDNCFHVNTMGRDNNRFEWREGDRAGVPADVLLDLVRRGRLWLNIRNVMEHHPEFRQLIDGMYDELESRGDGFRAEDRSANLLISSPGAIVHYHVDMPVNMLWHVRGRKRVWVYPPFDSRFVSHDVLERVFSGEMAEDVPYDVSMDRYALVYDVEPGDLITWPQNTPHRVTNLDSLNISLSTEHKNPAARRRINVHLANQWLRRTCGLPCRSSEIDGWAAHAKQAVIRSVRLARRVTRKKQTQFTYPVSFRVDPDAPLGYTDLPGSYAGDPVSHDALAV